jgi:glycosyltransferase involved in cell wall biosynthesis
VAIVAQVPQKSEIAFAVQEEECGIVVEPEDPDRLVEALKYLKNNEEERLKMARNARRAFEEKYTTRKIADRYIEIVKAVT